MRVLLVLLTALVGVSALPLSSDEQPATAIVGRGRGFNKILAKVIALFPVNVAIGVLSGTVTVGEAVIAATFGVPIIETISPSSACPDVGLFFARGTLEARNMGLLVGPPFADAVLDALAADGKTIGVQGTEYPASIADYYNDNPKLGTYMANEIKQVLARCPSTKVVISGYSQGGVVAHKAANELGEAVMRRSVSAFVTFGDPDQHEAVPGIDASRVKVFCNIGDDACNHGTLLLPQHLTYGFNAKEAAQFITAHL